MAGATEGGTSAEVVGPIGGVPNEGAVIAGVATTVLVDVGGPIEPKVGEKRDVDMAPLMLAELICGTGLGGGVAIPAFVPVVTVVPPGAGATAEGALLIPF